MVSKQLTQPQSALRRSPRAVYDALLYVVVYGGNHPICMVIAVFRRSLARPSPAQRRGAAGVDGDGVEKGGIDTLVSITYEQRWHRGAGEQTPMGHESGRKWYFHR